MAFATALVRKSVFGDLKVLAGDWTGTVGDAAGTVEVEGGKVYLAQFSIQDTDSPTQGMVPFSISTTGAITTVTVYNHETVTTGRFLIVHA
jgi:hypothetical protein